MARYHSVPFRLAALAAVLFGLGATLYADPRPGDDTPAQDNTLTDAEREAGWVLMFNGEDLAGWKCSTDNPDSVRVEDGCIVTNGPRAHLFFGEQGDAQLRDFEFRADVYCVGKSNSGIYLHTRYQADGWPAHGLEAQVCNGFPDPRKTGSIYSVSDLTESPVRDDAWFHYHIKVQGRNVKLWINGELVQDWTQPEDWGDARKRLSAGTIALQAHDPGSKVLYKNIKLLTVE